MIELRNISKSYNRDKPVIVDISLSVLPNEICCLLGKNGVGKSTILNIVLQLVRQSSGQVLINNSEVSGSSCLIDLGVGMLSQFDNLIDEITGYQYLEFQCILFGIASQERRKRIDTLVEYFFEYSDDIYKKISGFSFGMRMKLRLIAIFIHKPSILILDEPFSHLDPFSAEKLINLLNEYKTIRRNTVLLSSHDLLHVEKIASKIVVLHNKSLVFNGTLSEFTKDKQVQIGEKLFDLVEEKHISTKNISWLW